MSLDTMSLHAVDDATQPTGILAGMLGSRAVDRSLQTMSGLTFNLNDLLALAADLGQQIKNLQHDMDAVYLTQTHAKKQAEHQRLLEDHMRALMEKLQFLHQEAMRYQEELYLAQRHDLPEAQRQDLEATYQRLQEERQLLEEKLQNISQSFQKSHVLRNERHNQIIRQKIFGGALGYSSLTTMGPEEEDANGAWAHEADIHGMSLMGDDSSRDKAQNTDSEDGQEKDGDVIVLNKDLDDDPPPAFYGWEPLIQWAMAQGYKIETDDLKRFSMTTHAYDSLKSKIRDEITRARKYLSGHRTDDAGNPIETFDPYPDPLEFDPELGVGEDGMPRAQKPRVIPIDELKLDTPEGIKEYINNLEQLANTVGNDRQQAFLKIQFAVQQILENINLRSSTSKGVHDMGMAVIRKIGG